MRALFGVILVGITALVAGAIGYQAGISSAVATSAAASGTVVYHAGWGFGFPGFGLGWGFGTPWNINGGFNRFGVF